MRLSRIRPQQSGIQLFFANASQIMFGQVVFNLFQHARVANNLARRKQSKIQRINTNLAQPVLQNVVGSRIKSVSTCKSKTGCNASPATKLAGGSSFVVREVSVKFWVKHGRTGKERPKSHFFQAKKHNRGERRGGVCYLSFVKWPTPPPENFAIVLF